MDWIRLHPYASACVGAGLLLIGGTWIVERQVAVAPSTTSGTWGTGNTPLVNPTSYSPENPVLTALGQQAVPSGAENLPPVPVAAQSSSTAISTNAGDQFDFNAFVAQLSQPSGNKTQLPTTTDPSIGLAYSFIPQGMISTSSATKTRSNTQQVLYDYGNEAGSYIQTFENTHQNNTQILKDQVEDRQNPDKATQVKNVAAALASVGLQLEGMGDVPTQAQGLHDALAKSYEDAGKNLARIPAAESDQDFIAAINAYNASADLLIKHYTALATFLSLSGVTFAPQDPGSVFTFTAGGGL